MTLKNPSRTSLPLVSFEITKSWAPLSSDRPIYMMNSTVENANGNWLISQASSFLSFKIGMILKDIFLFNRMIDFLNENTKLATLAFP